MSESGWTTSTTPTHTQQKHTHAAMLAVHPLSLMDALLLDAPRCLAPKRQRLHLPRTALQETLAEDATAYHITMAVPGVRTSDISAMVNERTLRITGETKTKHRHARISRSIVLPIDADVRSQGVKVVHEDGILSISVPKREPHHQQLVISTPDPTATDAADDSAAEDATAYHITMAVPGVSTSDVSSQGVKVVHEDGILSISVPKCEPHHQQLVISTPDPNATDAAGGFAAAQEPKHVANSSEVEQSFA